MSGQLKSYVKTFGKSEENEQKFEGDRWVELLNKPRKLENKKRTLKAFSGYYKRVEVDKAIIVGDSFVMMNQQVAHRLLLGAVDIEEVLIPDKRFKTIHGYFDQDNSSIVTMVAKEGKFYKDYIFCFTVELYHQLIKFNKGV